MSDLSADYYVTKGYYLLSVKVEARTFHPSVCPSLLSLLSSLIYVIMIFCVTNLTIIYTAFINRVRKRKSATKTPPGASAKSLESVANDDSSFCDVQSLARRSSDVNSSSCDVIAKASTHLAKDFPLQITPVNTGN
jgi:hypothetical protein